LKKQSVDLHLLYSRASRRAS